MTSRPLLCALLAGLGLLAAAPLPALAAEPAPAAAPVVINSFGKAQIAAVNDKQEPVTVAAKDFTFPLTSTGPGPDNRVGVRWKGETIYLRRIDLNLAPTACASVTSRSARDGDVMTGGSPMGAGASNNCRVGGQ